MAISLFTTSKNPLTSMFNAPNLNIPGGATTPETLAPPISFGKISTTSDLTPTAEFNLNQRFDVPEVPQMASVAGAQGAGTPSPTPEPTQFEQFPPLPEGQTFEDFRAQFEEAGRVSPELEAERAGLFSQFKTFLQKPFSRLEAFREEEARLSPIEAGIRDIDKQLLSTREKFQKSAQLEKYGRETTAGVLTGRLKALEETRQIEEGLLIAQREALTGDYERGFKRAQYIADLMEQDFRANLDTVKTQLDLVGDMISGEQKIGLDALKAFLDQKEKMLELEIDTRDRKIETMLKYPGAGIRPTDTWGEIQMKITKSPKYLKEISTKSETDASKAMTLTDAQLRSLSVLGVSPTVAQGIFNDFNAGFSKEQIKQNIISGLGVDEKQADSIIENMQTVITKKSIFDIGF